MTMTKIVTKLPPETWNSLGKTIASRCAQAELVSGLLQEKKQKKHIIEKPSTVTKVCCPQNIFSNRKLKEVQQVEQRKAQEAERWETVSWYENEFHSFFSSKKR